jgi:hypothetical protein
MHTIERTRAAFRKVPLLLWLVASLLLVGGVLLVMAMLPAGPTVTGVVLLDGQRLEQGAIRLVPVEGTTGSDGGAVIRRGKYRIEKGLSEGKYKVEILGTRFKPGKKARNPVDSTYIDPEEAIPLAELAPNAITVGPGLNTHDFTLKERRRP